MQRFSKLPKLVFKALWSDLIYQFIQKIFIKQLFCAALASAPGDAVVSQTDAWGLHSSVTDEDQILQ